ncbi:DNA-binding helix-turn-helix protein [Catenibacterium mitsuokai DSM 15897]|nr:helix-turn-helix transcriptional regulator [Lysobacter enzymogenes]EEF93760.1 DNA-binding helix-turn-helix protein [Catenibacterium mitsuokai DSM 15897]
MAQTEVDARSIFAQRLKAAREDAGLTQKELGMSVGLPQEAAAVRINRYEKGVHDADLATARRIAQSLGVPLAFLYADTDVLAEAILTLGLLSKSEQRKAVADLKARLAQVGAMGEKD